MKENAPPSVPAPVPSRSAVIDIDQQASPVPTPAPAPNNTSAGSTAGESNSTQESEGCRKSMEKSYFVAFFYICIFFLMVNRYLLS